MLQGSSRRMPPDRQRASRSNGNSSSPGKAEPSGTRPRSRAEPSTSNTRSLMATPVEPAAGCEGRGSAGAVVCPASVGRCVVT